MTDLEIQRHLSRGLEARSRCCILARILTFLLLVVACVPADSLARTSSSSGGNRGMVPAQRRITILDRFAWHPIGQLLGSQVQQTAIPQQPEIHGEFLVMAAQTPQGLERLKASAMQFALQGGALNAIREPVLPRNPRGLAAVVEIHPTRKRSEEPVGGKCFGFCALAPDASMTMALDTRVQGRGIERALVKTILRIARAQALTMVETTLSQGELGKLQLLQSLGFEPLRDTDISRSPPQRRGGLFGDLDLFSGLSERDLRPVPLRTASTIGPAHRISYRFNNRSPP
jgi:GNAT superfamily N-acetyltransferase